MRLPKGESFECRDTLKANSLRLSVSKSYSFGGYPVAVLSRGDSCTSTHSAGARLLTKQGMCSIFVTVYIFNLFLLSIWQSSLRCLWTSALYIT
jgi:hypothetical protein